MYVSMYLNDAPERAVGAFGGVGAEPRGVAPDDLAVTAGDDLVATHHQLQRPHSGRHLPEHKAPILPTPRPQALHTLPRRYLRFAAYHLHRPRGVHIFHPLLLLQTPRCRQVLLYDVTGTRRLLLITPYIFHDEQSWFIYINVVED